MRTTSEACFPLWEEFVVFFLRLKSSRALRGEAAGALDVLMANLYHQFRTRMLLCAAPLSTPSRLTLVSSVATSIFGRRTLPTLSPSRLGFVEQLYEIIY